MAQYTTAEEAVKNIESGSHVFIHSVAAAPLQPYRSDDSSCC